MLEENQHSLAHVKRAEVQGKRSFVRASTSPLLGVGTVGVASEHGCLPDIVSSLVTGILSAISGVLVGSPTLVVDVGFGLRCTLFLLT